MKKHCKKMIFGCLLVLTASLSLSGCKPSQKKVEESPYYQDLLSKYEKLQKENKALQKESDSQEQLSESEQRAENYLAKIARDRLAKLEVGFADNMAGSEFIDVPEIFPVATNLALHADRTNKYTPETLAEAFEARYMYVLYDEDNAIYEITIYGSDYAVFSDLPKYVYYIPNASALGEAFLRYRTSYPSSSLLHRLADSPLMIDSKGNYYENHVAAATATCIDKMEKEKSSRKKAEKVWAKKEENKREDGTYEPASIKYTYFHHGNILEVTLYDRYFSVKNVDDKRTWYKVDKPKIQGIKNILKQDREAREAIEKSLKKKTASGEADKNSHSKEIEEESIITSSEAATETK